MRRLTLGCSAAVLAGITFGAATPARAVTAHWAITDLTGVPGIALSIATDINESGQVIGNSYHGTLWSAQVRAFVWDKGHVTTLATLGGTTVEARDLNNSGQVVGWSTTKSGAKHAFFWQNGTITDIGVLPGMRSSIARAINDHGQVVGVSYNDLCSRGEFAFPCDQRAFLWQNGKLTALGTLGGTDSEALTINNRGEIIGSSMTGTGRGLRTVPDGILFYPRHAFLWRSGRMTDLGTLPDHQNGSTAKTINERGQVVSTAALSGSFLNSVSDDRPFLWQNGKRTDLGTLWADPGSNNSGEGFASAQSMNDLGQVVGVSSGDGPATLHAVLWEHGTVIDLSALGPVHGESDVSEINNRSQIVGSGSIGTPAHERALLWQDPAMTDLGTLPGGTSSSAVAINGHDAIVGRSTTKTGTMHAVLWTLTRG